MKVKIHDEKCIGCGSCVSLTDQKIFDFDQDGKACVVCENIVDSERKKVEDACSYCPTSAIEILDDDQVNN